LIPTSCQNKEDWKLQKLLKFLKVQEKIYAWHIAPQNDKNLLQEACKAKEEEEKNEKNEDGERRRRKEKIRKCIKQKRLST
jgi:hypothetical protein